jgi:hypothetical protein
VSGLWHGARWTFVVWGALHGAYLIASLASERARARVRDSLGLARHPAVLAVWQTSVVFILVTVGWVFFRATSLGDAWYVLTHLGAGLGGQLAAVVAREPAAQRDLLFLGFEPSKLILATTAVLALLAVERLQGSGPVRVRLARAAAPLRWATYACAVLTIMTLGIFQSARFIYFQF